jgi:hypothetical protein
MKGEDYTYDPLVNEINGNGKITNNLEKKRSRNSELF